MTIGFFGEQFLHPNFIDYLGELTSVKTARIILFTNWLVATRDQFEQLRKVNSMRISLDTTIPEHFDEICPGDYVLDIDGNKPVDRLGSFEDKLEVWLKEPHPPTALIHIESPATNGQAQALVKRWKPFLSKHDEIIIKPWITYGGIMGPVASLKRRCSIAKSNNKLTISYNGNCTPCNLDVNIAICGGNLLKTPDAQVMMASPRWKRALHAMQHGDEELCQSCPDANNHVGMVKHSGKQ